MPDRAGIGVGWQLAGSKTGGDRWQTVGRAGPVILLVVHIWLGVTNDAARKFVGSGLARYATARRRQPRQARIL
jgi:hypothetical protein